MGLPPGIKVNELSAGYVNKGTRTQVFENLSFGLALGQIGVIVGPSGSGKSTLLNCVAGLQPFNGGSVDIAIDGGRTLLQHSQTSHLTPSDRRRIGVAFQQSHLWSNMSVLANLVHPQVWLAGASRAVAEKRARMLLEMLRLEPHADARTSDLSGGQRQRVAILRALALKPDVLLLDEITASQDPANIRAIFDLIKNYSRETGATVLTISHDMEFVQKLADRIYMLQAGCIVAQGSPSELLNLPEAEIIRSFANAFRREG